MAIITRMQEKLADLEKRVARLEQAEPAQAEPVKPAAKARAKGG